MLQNWDKSRHVRRVRDFVTTEAPLLAAIAIISGLILAFLQIADEMIEGEMEFFDDTILMWFRDPTNIDQTIGPSWVHEMVRDITALGSFSLLGLIVAVVCISLVMAHKRGAALLVIISVLGGTLISTVLKSSYDRPRPELATMSEQFTASFPSGHAMLSAVTFLTLGAVLAQLAPTRALRIFSFTIAIVLTVMVGMSRIYMGVHFPSDVLAGWCLGAAWALLCSTAAMMLKRRGTVERINNADI
nr:phosphatase PAP2 family protein [uncultured Devosia sp.]